MMPELHENDLHSLFRSVGHTVPEQDLTDRIMARVAVTRFANPVKVLPVIGGKGWLLIMVVALLIAVAGALSPMEPLPAWTGTIANGSHWLSSRAGEWSIWLALFACTLLVCKWFDARLEWQQSRSGSA